MSFCGQCGRGNGPKRRYCGGCGGFLAAVCGRCEFTDNDVGDGFCGGCGHELVVHKALAKGTGAPPLGGNRELAGLFNFAPARAEVAGLPEANVSQDDVDRLFSRSKP